MANMDAGTGSMLIVLIPLIFVLFGALIFGWVVNIVAAVKTSQLGQNQQTRLILHIVGIFVQPLGSIMGLMWFFNWRKSDGSHSTPPPPPPTGTWAPPTA